ncbi:hypothetical protein AXI59_07735 [Bacillus nakamurai]|nr:hypothetical protein AXI59_07735 [Bacillus nakamurai]
MSFRSELSDSGIHYFQTYDGPRKRLSDFILSSIHTLFVSQIPNRIEDFLKGMMEIVLCWTLSLRSSFMQE